jgi:small GTP-binding protein
MRITLSENSNLHYKKYIIIYYMNRFRVSLQKEPDFTFKLLVIGDGTCGKSSILNRYIDNSFYQNYISTIGVDFKIKLVDINNKLVKFQIWDTAGQERFKSITTSYYRGVIGIMLIYDVSNKETFNNIDNWISDINKFAPPEVLIVLVGNKSDSNKRQVMIEEGINKANNLGIPFIETSAKDNINIEKPFEIIADKLSSNVLDPLLSIPQFESLTIQNEKSFLNKWCMIL